jgi:hypothetical protein
MALHVPGTRGEVSLPNVNPLNWRQCGRTVKDVAGVMAKHRIYTTSFSSVYPAYVAKAERKGRTKTEVDQIILWLTGYSQAQFGAHVK